MTNSTIIDLQQRHKMREIMHRLAGNPGDQAIAVIYHNPRENAVSIRSIMPVPETADCLAHLAHAMMQEMLKQQPSTPAPIDPVQTDPRVEFASGNPEIDEGLHGDVEPEPRDDPKEA